MSTAAEEDVSFAPIIEPQTPTPPAYPTPVAAPAILPSGLKRYKCDGCGGAIEYQESQGLFKCPYCSSVYEASAGAEAGGAAVRAIHDVVKTLEGIDTHMSVERWQKKAADVQDKIDFKYIEFDNSFPRKAGSLAVIAWIAAALLFLFVVGQSFIAAFLLAGVLAAIGYGLFTMFTNAKKEFEAEAAQMRENELGPVHDKLKELGAVLNDGSISIGFTESTTVPQRYCVCCHKNVMPKKPEGVKGANFANTNLLLTVATCGMWIPAWIIMAVLMKGGGSASRALRSGACPECGTTTLFPARIPNV
jgi:ribosomal protein L37AE/L43A